MQFAAVVVVYCGIENFIENVDFKKLVDRVFREEFHKWDDAEEYYTYYGVIIFIGYYLYYSKLK